jgi:hypothetical protein
VCHEHKFQNFEKEYSVHFDGKVGPIRTWGVIEFSCSNRPLTGSVYLSMRKPFVKRKNHKEEMIAVCFHCYILMGVSTIDEGL